MKYRCTGGEYRINGGPWLPMKNMTFEYTDTAGTLHTPFMLTKQITFFGEQQVIACDGRCDKAWGINGRPHRKLSEDPDDTVDLPDSALGTAPGPGYTNTFSEGCDCKPSAVAIRCDGTQGYRMNRWCCRECERSVIVKPGEPIELRDMEHPRPNVPRSES